MNSKYYDVLHNRSSGNSFMARTCSEKPKDNVVFFYVIQNRTISGTIAIDNRIDEDSKIILNTFNKELENVYSPHMTTIVPTLRLSKSTTQQIEYSSLIHSLAKIMEIELNNSIVQYLRKVNGIEMPQYYKLFKPQFDAIVPIGKDGCNINSQHNGVLNTQTIGSIQCLIKYYKDLLNELFESPIENFISLWEKIREKRNDSSHTKIITEEEFVIFYNHFCEIVRGGWFTKLMDIKEELRGY